MWLDKFNMAKEGHEVFWRPLYLMEALEVFAAEKPDISYSNLITEIDNGSGGRKDRNRADHCPVSKGYEFDKVIGLKSVDDI